MDFLEGIVYLLFFVLVGLSAYYFYEKSGFQLKCIVSGVNGNQYCVRERHRLDEAANLLAKTTDKCKQLVTYLKEKHGDDARVQRLVERFRPDKIGETLPTSSYTAYSENKGEAIKFCLNQVKENNDNLIDEHTLMFVALHEMSHVFTVSIGHKTEFWDNFKWLLERAKDCGVHEPIDYSKEGGREYCGMKINSNPFYNR